MRPPLDVVRAAAWIGSLLFSLAFWSLVVLAITSL